MSAWVMPLARLSGTSQHRCPIRRAQHAAPLTKREWRFGGIAGPNGLVCGAVADGFVGEEGLLADAAGDFGEIALVGADGGQVVGLADEIEGAEGFPDLFVAGVHRGDLGASGYVCSRGCGERADASADGRAHFDRLLAV